MLCLLSALSRRVGALQLFIIIIIAIIIHSFLQWPCSRTEAMLSKERQRESNQRLKRTHTIRHNNFVFTSRRSIVNAPLLEVRTDLVFARMPGESDRVRFGPLLLCSCDVFRALINSLCLWILYA